MDSYVDQLQSQGGSMIMLAKGSRSQQADLPAKHGGYGRYRRPAAVLAQRRVPKRTECVEYPELGMEAIWKEVKWRDFSEPLFTSG